MNVLFVAAEGVPFIKTGGLGDVIGSLPKALANLGVNVRVVLPKHRDINEEARVGIQLKHKFEVNLGWRRQYLGIEEKLQDGIHFYFIDNEYYFKREGLYGYEDDAERYAFFAKAVLESLPFMDFKPDIIHCHDWHAALVSVLLKTKYKENEFYKGIKTILTIHNIQYQGVFNKDVLKDLLQLDEEYYSDEYLGFYDQVNCLKGGIIFSDLISTVSKSYAEEIQMPYFGEGLDGMLRKRSEDLIGIMNGLNYEYYNPKTDKFIYANYNKEQHKKRKNKLELQKELGLPVREDVPMVAIISRLAVGKGFDLIAAVLDEMLSMDIQLVVLGTGDWIYENLFRSVGEWNKGKLSANITFDNALAHKIYAASDIFLMPSKFEPCGLSQLIALRYGSIPVVRETGGLRDTIQPYNVYTNEGNGLCFRNFNAHEMLSTLKMAIDLYYDKEEWDNLFLNAVNSDFSWQNSSIEYESLYQKLLNKGNA